MQLRFIAWVLAAVLSWDAMVVHARVALPAADGAFAAAFAPAPAEAAAFAPAPAEAPAADDDALDDRAARPLSEPAPEGSAGLLPAALPIADAPVTPGPRIAESNPPRAPDLEGPLRPPRSAAAVAA